jgi:chromosome segregation ATPase
MAGMSAEAEYWKDLAAKRLIMFEGAYFDARSARDEAAANKTMADDLRRMLEEARVLADAANARCQSAQADAISFRDQINEAMRNLSDARDRQGKAEERAYRAERRYKALDAGASKIKKGEA